MNFVGGKVPIALTSRLTRKQVVNGRLVPHVGHSTDA